MLAVLSVFYYLNNYVSSPVGGEPRYAGIPRWYRNDWLWLKAVTGPDSAEATENTEWVRTEFTEYYGKLRSPDTGI